MKKSEKIQLIYLFSYIALIIAGMVCLLIFQKGWIVITLLVVFFLGYLGLSLVHSLCNYYICPKCKKQFSVNMFKDLFSRSGGKMGKQLTCPHCHEKNWMEEQSK